MFDATKFEERAKGIVEWLEKEYASIRTGQATPALLDSIQVESYGARVPLNQVGSVSAEDARTLRISVWDAGSISQVDQAITEADLGVSVVTDNAGIRVIFPELSGERREQLMKLSKSKLEESRVSIRSARDDAKKGIDTDADMSDDQKAGAREELQKLVDAKNQTLESLFETKEKELSL